MYCYDVILQIFTVGQLDTRQTILTNIIQPIFVFLMFATRAGHMLNKSNQLLPDRPLPSHADLTNNDSLNKEEFRNRR